MELNLFRSLKSLGIAGVALGVFYLLFKSVAGTFSPPPPGWVGPIIVLFMLLTTVIIYIALTLYAPPPPPDPQAIENEVERTRKLLQAPVVRGRSESAKRAKLAKQLFSNCMKWAQLLNDTFEKAGAHWSGKRKDVAAEVIAKQQRDLMKLDYWSLQGSSPLLQFLNSDERYREFTNACASFYVGAIELKGGIHDRILRAINDGEHVGEQQVANEVYSWKQSVEQSLRRVADGYHRSQVAA